MNERFKLKLLGAFELRSPSNKLVTGLGKKAQAIVAMLAVGAGRTITRTTLQDKLWSDRGHSHGRNSLRKALAQIRNATAPAQLINERPGGVICIPSKLLAVDIFEFDQVWSVESSLFDAQNLELMEGADIADPVFDEWLSQTRRDVQRWIAQAKINSGNSLQLTEVIKIQPPTTDANSQRKPILSINCSVGSQFGYRTELVVARDLFEHHLSNQLLSAGIGQVVLANDVNDYTDSDICIKVQLSEFDSKIIARILISRSPMHNILWSEINSMDRIIGNFEYKAQNLSSKVVGFIFNYFRHLENICPEEFIATQSYCSAVAALLCVGSQPTSRIEHWLEEANKIQSNSKILAWRAAACAMRFVEEPGA